MRTLYYHAGAGHDGTVIRWHATFAIVTRAFAAADAGALAPCSAPASRTPALADFVFSALQLYFNFTSTLWQVTF